MEPVSQFLFGSHWESWKRKKESVWSCLDVFFVLLRWLVHSSEGGKGVGFDHQQQVSLVRGWKKSRRLSKAILLSFPPSFFLE